MTTQSTERIFHSNFFSSQKCKRLSHSYGRHTSTCVDVKLVLVLIIVGTIPGHLDAVGRCHSTMDESKEWSTRSGREKTEEIRSKNETWTKIQMNIEHAAKKMQSSNWTYTNTNTTTNFVNAEKWNCLLFFTFIHRHTCFRDVRELYYLFSTENLRNFTMKPNRFFAFQKKIVPFISSVLDGKFRASTSVGLFQSWK